VWNVVAYVPGMVRQPKQPGKHAGGRPRTKTPKAYTPEQLAQIDAMALAQCKDSTIAAALGVDREAFRREFTQRTRQKRAQGKAEIMEAQLKRARTNAVGAIWWGKQHLGQTDRADVTSGGKAVSIGMTIIKPEGVK